MKTNKEFLEKFNKVQLIWSDIYEDCKPYAEPFKELIKVSSISRYDIENKIITVAFHPTYKNMFKLYEENKILLDIIKSYFGDEYKIYFESNDAIVFKDHLIFKEG